MLTVSSPVSDQEETGKAAILRNLNVVAISPNRRHLDRITAALKGIVSPGNVSAVEDSVSDACSFSESVPHILIVDCAEGENADLEALDRLSQVHPNLAMIALHERYAPDFLLRAMRAGIGEVLDLSFDQEAMKSAMLRIAGKHAFSPPKRGKVLAFISSKGGSGATFLATNLAYALASQQNKKVALFDLILQFGDASLFLTDQKPSATLSDVVHGIHRLDASFLASSMVNIASNLSVLCAPEDPALAMEVRPEHIDALVNLARQEYDFLILDIGRHLDASTIRALDHADQIFTVLQTALPFIREGKRLIEVFQTLDYAKDKLRFIVNRQQKNSDISVKDLEQALGIKISRTIPNHYEAASSSINQGVPIVKLARSSPIARSLAEWSEEIGGEPRQGSASWLARALRRA